MFSGKSYKNTVPCLLLGIGFISSMIGATTAFAGEVRYDGEGHAYHPVWSPDGKYLAFEVNRFAGDVDLFISEVSGDIAADASKINLPASKSVFGGGAGVVAANPVWHPEGFAFFEGSNQGGKFRIYYVQPGGAAPLELLSTSQVAGNMTFPALSPDGNTLAFVTDQTGNGDVRSWNRVNDSFTSLTSHDGSEAFPLFSPSSTSLLFSRKKNNAEDSFELNMSTYNEAAVGNGNGDQTRPVYASNGAVLFFSSERGNGEWDIVSTVSGNKKTLAKGVRLPHRARPAISSDGEWVAYVYDDPSKADYISVTRIDGSRTVKISTEFKACGEPAIVTTAGRTLLAYTALPPSGSDWRFLFVQDITGKL